MSEVIIGWKNIAEAMRMSTRSAERMARRAFDPMPVRKLHGGVYARPESLAAWQQRQDAAVATHKALADLGGTCRIVSSCNDG